MPVTTAPPPHRSSPLPLASWSLCSSVRAHPLPTPPLSSRVMRWNRKVSPWRWLWPHLGASLRSLYPLWVWHMKNSWRLLLHEPSNERKAQKIKKQAENWGSLRLSNVMTNHTSILKGLKCPAATTSIQCCLIQSSQTYLAMETLFPEQQCHRTHSRERCDLAAGSSR